VLILRFSTVQNLLKWCYVSPRCSCRTPHINVCIWCTLQMSLTFLSVSKRWDDFWFVSSSLRLPSYCAPSLILGLTYIFLKWLSNAVLEKCTYLWPVSMTGTNWRCLARGSTPSNCLHCGSHQGSEELFDITSNLVGSDDNLEGLQEPLKLRAIGLSSKAHNVISRKVNKSSPSLNTPQQSQPSGYAINIRFFTLRNTL